jgi:flagella basal body P-ring formation protein FlgA
MSLLLLSLALAATDPLAPLEGTQPEVRPERLVRRGEPVTLRLRNGPLTISTAGRALTDGLRGARVRVVALSTRRTLDGIVEGPGDVRIVAP